MAPTAAEAMKSAPVFRLWMNSSVAKSRGLSVISRSRCWPAIIPSRPMARARSRARAHRTTSPGVTRPSLREELERPVLQSKRSEHRRGLADTERGRSPVRVAATASSMHGRSSRMRLAVCTISTAQPAGRTRAGSPPRSSATSVDEDGPQVAWRARRGSSGRPPRPATMARWLK